MTEYRPTLSQSVASTVSPFGFVQAAIETFRFRFKRKLVECTARGFTVEECFEFLWTEALEEAGIRGGRRSKKR